MPVKVKILKWSFLMSGLRSFLKSILPTFLTWWLTKFHTTEPRYTSASFNYLVLNRGVVIASWMNSYIPVLWICYYLDTQAVSLYSFLFWKADLIEQSSTRKRQFFVQCCNYKLRLTNAGKKAFPQCSFEKFRWDVIKSNRLVGLEIIYPSFNRTVCY